MVFLNASGNPVATAMHSIQIDIPIPTEPINSLKMPSLSDFIMVAWQFFIAYSSGDALKIAAAIQAFIKLFF